MFSEANKVDLVLDRSITLEHVGKYKFSMQAGVYIASLLTGECVTDLANGIVRCLYEYRYNSGSDLSMSAIDDQRTVKHMSILNLIFR